MFPSPHPLFRRSALLAVAFTVIAVGAWLSSRALAAPALGLKTESSALPSEVRARTSLAPTVRKAAPSVVNIYTAKTVRQEPALAFNDPFFRQFFGAPFERIPQERRERSLGSGVIVTSDGYLLTNNHVVEGADEIKVLLADGRTVHDAKLIGTDPQTDIAVLRIEGAPGPLPAITLADSDMLEVGDLVIAIGNPFGVGQTVTSGIVSATGRGGMGILDYEDFIQTDASINPGNSGGALVDASGRLVGINTAILSRNGGSSGVGFAVPVNLARYVLERIVAEGKVVRSQLGVMIQSVTPELAKEFKLPDAKGALIGEVTRRSPAERAGLKDGDVIIEFDGRQIEDSRHLRLMVAQTPPGASIRLKIVRDGREQSLTAKLEEAPAGRGFNRANRGGSGGWRRGGSNADVVDGVAVDELEARARRQFDIPSAVRGVVVTDVEPTSAAAAAGLQPGDVIQEINRQPVASVDEAVEASRRSEGQRMLLRVWSRGGSRYLVVDAPRARR
jgi:serine protease Do